MDDINEEIIKTGGNVMESIEENTSDNLIEKRKEKLKNLISKKSFWIILILIFLIFIGAYIRVQNITNPVNPQGLKDIVTGEWTLGPDLDPFLFLRLAKHIVAEGSLMKIDYMRYVPIGHDTSTERPLLSYSIAWIYQIISLFKDISIEYAAIIAPVIFFILTSVAFFLFVRKIFDKKNKNAGVIALIATAFFIVISVLVPRTVAGIPEKESLGFLFIFLTFYFFILAWNSETKKKMVLYSFLAGVATMLMAITWGGMAYILYTIPACFLILFLIKKSGKKELIIYCIWTLTHLILVQPFYSEERLNILGSFNFDFLLFVFFLLIINFILFRTKIKENKFIRKIREKFNKIPESLLSLIIGFLILGVLASIVVGPEFIIDRGKDVINNFVHPLGTLRFILTVAENRQPFFHEIASSYGPLIFGKIYLFFWLFLIGSIYLFSLMVKKSGIKNRIILTSLYTLFLIGIIFSRYSSESIFNGEGFMSNLLYFGSIALFVGYLGYLYFKNKEDIELNFGYLLITVFFVVSLFAARGAVRLVMVIAPAAAVMVGFLIFSSIKWALKKDKEEINKIISWVLAIIILIASIYCFYSYYQESKNMVRSYIPSSYNYQWQKAMAWVRENTDKDAVFGHWWDYGYWVQTIGERATVLDGANLIIYWNHLMGRHVLTGYNEKEALDFLYAHNTTHFLIDSTDIGKYPAYSSIGSDINYDKYSYLPIFTLDESQTLETNEGIIRLYRGGFALDEDLLYKKGDEEVFYPAGRAAIAAVKIDLESIKNKKGQPEIILIYQDKQELLPLRYIYLDGQLYDFGKGYGGGLYIMPSITQTTSGININEFGASIFLSERTIKTNLVKLYLFNQENNFKLVHSQDNLYIEDLKSQGANINDIVLFQGGLLGPIKIWEIKYPSGMKIKEEYLELDYPDSEVAYAGPIY